MPGNEPIRFGVMYGGYSVDVRNFDRFAKEGITLDELKAVIGEKNIKNMPLFEKMFASIAKDDLMDANELFGYFKKLDNAAELNTKNYTFSENDLVRKAGEELGDLLQADELLQMENARGNVGKKANTAQTETMFQFVTALIQKNDEKVQAEMQKEAETAAKEAQRAAEEAELASRTTVDPKTGNVKVVDKDNPKSSETRDKYGKLIQKTYTDDWYYNKMTSNPWGYLDDATVTEIYKDGKVVKRIIKGKRNVGTIYNETLTENIDPRTGYLKSSTAVVRKLNGELVHTAEFVYGKPRTEVVEWDEEDGEGNVIKSYREEVIRQPYSLKIADAKGRILDVSEMNGDCEYHHYNNDGTVNSYISRNGVDISRLSYENGQPIAETVRGGNGLRSETFYKDGEPYVSYDYITRKGLYKNKETVNYKDVMQLKEGLIKYYTLNGVKTLDIYGPSVADALPNIWGEN